MYPFSELFSKTSSAKVKDAIRDCTSDLFPIESTFSMRRLRSSRLFEDDQRQTPMNSSKMPIYGDITELLSKKEAVAEEPKEHPPKEEKLEIKRARSGIKKTNVRRKYTRHKPVVLSKKSDEESIQNLVQKIFTEKFDPVKTALLLSPIEKQVFAAIFTKKFPKANKALAPEEQMRIFQDSNMKRDEENYKFVFKRVMKKMLNEFLAEQLKTSTDKKKTRKQNSIFFYRLYFEKPAARAEESIEAYMIPQSVKHEDNPKTFDKKFISRIKQSPEFVKEFKKTIESQKKSIEREIQNKTKKVIEVFTQKFLFEKKFAEFFKYLESEKCKLPWTIHEALKAYDFVKTKLS